jgi:hypothetical protein
MEASLLPFEVARPWLSRGEKNVRLLMHFTLPIDRDFLWLCRNRWRETITTFLISKYSFRPVTITFDRAYISTEGLFINVNAGFDSKDFREACSTREINANIYFNKLNGTCENRD